MAMLTLAPVMVGRRALAVSITAFGALAAAPAAGASPNPFAWAPGAARSSSAANRPPAVRGAGRCTR